MSPASSTRLVLVCGSLFFAGCGGITYVSDGTECEGDFCDQICTLDSECPSGTSCRFGRCSTATGLPDEDVIGGDGGDGTGGDGAGDGGDGLIGDEDLGDSPIGGDNPFAGDGDDMGDGSGGDVDPGDGGDSGPVCDPNSPAVCNDDNCNGTIDPDELNSCGNCKLFPLCNDSGTSTGNPGATDTGDLIDPYTDGDDVNGDGVTWSDPDGDGFGSVSLSGGTVATDFAWPASQENGTVSRVDTLPGSEREVALFATVLRRPDDPRKPYVAPYDHTPTTSPRTACQDPSRSTIDEFGNAYIANRAVDGYGGRCDNEEIAPNTMSSVTKIAFYNEVLCNGAINVGLEGCQCQDRNGDGFIQTSRDYDGDTNMDGRVIEPSTCPGNCDSVSIGPCVGAGCDTPCEDDDDCASGSVCVFDPSATTSMDVPHKQRCSTAPNLPEFLGVFDECLMWTTRIPGIDSDAAPFSSDTCTGATCADASTYCNEAARSSTQCGDNLCNGDEECTGAPNGRTECSAFGCSYCNEGARGGTQCGDGLCDGDQECSGAPNGAIYCAPNGCSTTIYYYQDCVGADCSYCNEGARGNTQCNDNRCNGNEECQGAPNGGVYCVADEGCSRMVSASSGSLRAGARGMALDKDGYVWVGAHLRSTAFKLDADGNFIYPVDPDGAGPLTVESPCPTTLRYVATGQPVPAGSESDCVAQACYETIPASCRINAGIGAYGAVVDSGRAHPNRFGYLWLTNSNGNLRRVDTETGAVATAPSQPNAYGITIDHKDRAWTPDSAGNDAYPQVHRHNRDVCVGAGCSTSCTSDASCGAGQACYYGVCSTQLGTWTTFSPSLCMGPWCDFCDSDGDGVSDTNGACADNACDSDTECGTAGAGYRKCSVDTDPDASRSTSGCTKECSTNADCRPYWGAECNNNVCSWDRHNGNNVNAWRGRGATTELIGDAALCAAQGAPQAPCARVWTVFHNDDWNAGANNPPNMVFAFDADTGKELIDLRRRIDRSDFGNTNVNGEDNACSGPVGLGMGIGGRLWSVNYQDDTMCWYDPSDPLGDIGSVKIDLNPYTYSDFTGNLFRSFTNPQGKYKVLLQACPFGYVLADWIRVDWLGTVPGQSTIEVRWRFGATPGQASNPAVAQQGPFIQTSSNNLGTADLGTGTADWIEVEFNLKAGDDGSRPTLDDFDVVRECAIEE